MLHPLYFEKVVLLTFLIIFLFIRAIYKIRPFFGSINYPYVCTIEIFFDAGQCPRSCRRCDYRRCFW